jgi:dTDP-4-amino-4,6-dideoxygalactose transaminase
VNSRLDEVQAIFLNLKLSSLDAANELRRQIARKYLKEINNTKIQLPLYSNKNDHVFYVFAVRVKDREKFRSFLDYRGIETHIHYPIAPYRQDALKSIDSSKFPVSDKIHETVVSIPLNQSLSEEEVNRIIDVLNTY